MDYLKPAEVVNAMIEAGARKAALSVSDLLVCGALAGAILGIATSFAITASVQTGVPCRRADFPGRVRDDRFTESRAGYRKFRCY